MSDSTKSAKLTQGDTMKEIMIDGVKFVPETAVKAESLDGLEYKIVRTYSAGVFAGYVKERKGQEVTLVKARRLWSWQGAASLSQLAQSGTSKPSQCKFPEEVDEVLLTNAIEILAVTAEAKATIDAVPVWKA